MDPETASGRPASPGRLPRDFMSGMAIMAFCAAAYWASLSIREAPAALAQNVQPATFPRMVIGVIAALTALMMALGLGRAEARRRPPRLVMLVTGAAMVSFVIAFGAFGLLASMFLFCLVMPMIWGVRPSARLLAFAVAFPLFVHLLFNVGLRVHFPPGVVEDLIDGVLS